jgi:hemoglobin-like flavoprotein
MENYLSASQVQLLKKTFRQINTDQFSDYFYSRLFELHPEVRHLFPKEMEELKTKLVSVFELMVFSFVEETNGKFTLQPELITPLSNLGKLHEDKGVLTAHYKIANALMLESLAHCLGKSLTEEIKQIWTQALAFLTAAMLNPGKDKGNLKIQSGKTLREVFNDMIKKVRTSS